MARMIIVSDLHLDKHTAGFARFDDVAELLDASATSAIESKADAWICLGDVCDPEDGCSALRAVAKLGEVVWWLNREGVRTYLLAGNHDVVESGHGITTLSPLRTMPGNVVIERPSVIELSGIRGLALPYVEHAHGYDPEAFVLEHGKGARFVIGHLNLEGIAPGSETSEMPRGRDVFWPLDALARVCPDALLIGGHYHRRQVYRGVQIVGALAGALTFGEEGSRAGWLDVEVTQ